MTTVYLAGPYAAREHLAAAATELQAIGFRVRARWLDGKHDDPTDATPDKLHEHRKVGAQMDLDDIDDADVVVVFTADATRPPGDGHLHGWGTTGGRHVETGYALAQGKDVVLVGEQEKVFHALDEVVVCADWHRAVVHLAGALVHRLNSDSLAVAG